MIALVGILGSVGGLMSSVFPWAPKWAWNCVIFALLSLLIYRGLYEDLEKMVSFLVAAFSLIVIFCVLALQGTEHAITGAQLASGLRLAMPSEGAFTALAVMGSVGATAVELFIYPYWIREKGYPRFIGPRDDSPEWRERYRGWMRVVAVDAGVCTGIAVVITCAYYLLGASILNKLEVMPEGYEVVDNVSLIFTESLGGWAKNIFMFGAFCTLFSTLLVFAASSGRVMLDFLRQIRAVAPKTSEQRMVLLRVLQIGIPLLWLIGELAYAQKPFLLLRLGANCNNLLLIPLAFGVMHLAMRLGRAGAHADGGRAGPDGHHLGGDDVHRVQPVPALDLELTGSPEGGQNSYRPLTHPGSSVFVGQRDVPAPRQPEEDPGARRVVPVPVVRVGNVQLVEQVEDVQPQPHPAGRRRDRRAAGSSRAGRRGCSPAVARTACGRRGRCGWPGRTSRSGP